MVSHTVCGDLPEEVLDVVDLDLNEFLFFVGHLLLQKRSKKD